MPEQLVDQSAEPVAGTSGQGGNPGSRCGRTPPPAKPIKPVHDRHPLRRTVGGAVVALLAAGSVYAYFEHNAVQKSRHEATAATVAGAKAVAAARIAGAQTTIDAIFKSPTGDREIVITAISPNGTATGELEGSTGLTQACLQAARVTIEDALTSSPQVEQTLTDGVTGDPIIANKATDQPEFEAIIAGLKADHGSIC